MTTLLSRVITDATAQGRVPAASTQDPRDAGAAAAAIALAPVRSYLPAGIPASLVQRALMVWTGLFGVVSFELYGQLHQVVGEGADDRDAFFAECVRCWIRFMGLR